MTMGEKGKLLASWVTAAEEAREREQWGQVVEAADEYAKTARQMKSSANPGGSKLFTDKEKVILLRVSEGLLTQAKSIHDLSTADQSGSITQLLKVLKDLQLGRMVDHQSLPKTTSSDSIHLPSPPRDLQARDTLLHRSVLEPGSSYLDITINKVGIKDAESYFEPFITVSVRSASGACIEPPQDTPPSSRREPTYVVFNTLVEIQTPVDKLPSRSTIIFFELKHYKPGKKSKSTKCFSILEMDELHPGPVALEIYKKPTDYKGQKLSLLSVKPLYLHLILSFTHI